MRWKIWVINKSKNRKKEIKGSWEGFDRDCLLFRMFREEPELFTGIEFFE